MNETFYEYPFSKIAGSWHFQDGWISWLCQLCVEGKGVWMMLWMASEP
jgi:hypothetical protein